MADNAEDTLDDRLEVLQRRAENFRELLKDGEEVTIALADGQMHVEESYRSKFERKHPKLFGRMMSVEAQMDAGWSPYVVALAVSGSVLFGLPLHWWDAVVGEAVVEQLNGWWFFIVLPMAVLYVAHAVCGQWEKMAYRRNRKELLELIGAEQLDRDVLLVMLRDEDELVHVVHQLKLDKVVISH
jgi:hypothetical protein